MISKEYINCKEKLQYICNKHKDKGIQITTFDLLKNNTKYSCPYCAKENVAIKNRISEDVIINKCTLCNFTYVSKFIKNEKTIVRYICNSHKDKGIQDISWSVLNKKDKDGCPYCSGKKRTASDFYDYMKNNHDNIQILDGEYKTRESRFICKCLICNNMWKTSAESLLGGHGCFECYKIRSSKERQMSEEDFLKSIDYPNKNYKILSHYKGMKHKIDCICNICSHEWSPIADTLINQNTGCPICSHKRAGIKMRLSHDEFKERLYDLNKNIEIIGVYEKSEIKIRLKCLLHNIEYEQFPHEALAGKNSCPMCNSLSVGEDIIANTLDDMDINYIRQYRNDNCKDIRSLPFDFYLPSKNICIEYDGEQHFRSIDRFGGKDSFKITKKHDQIKDNFCINNNIKLIRIPYWEKKNIREILYKEVI